MGNIEMIILERMERLDKEIWHAVDMQKECEELDDQENLAFWKQQETAKIMVYMELRSILAEIKA